MQPTQPELTSLTSPAILKLEKFGVSFGKKIILNEVNLQVVEKNITVLFGPAGTGKSTLLRSIVGLNNNNPSYREWGEATFLNQPLKHENRPSLVSQSARLVMKSVLENIVHNLPERNNLTKLQQKDLAIRLLEQAGLESLKELLNENVINLPLSLQRHLAILRLASASPRLLCLDEPTSNLSEIEAKNILSHIKNESKRRAILIVLHNQQQARQLEGYSVLLAGGHVEEYNKTKIFFSEPSAPSTKQFIKSGSCSMPSPDARPEDLTEDTKPPPEIPHIARKYVSESFGPRGFLWLLNGQLAGTPLPGVFFDIEYDLKALQRVGINRLISTTQHPVDVQLLKKYNIKGKAFPIKDMGAPELEAAVNICQYIDEKLLANEVIAVHCRAGLGRTGTLLALYQIWKHNDALSALEMVRNIEPRWVQSALQVEFLEKFSQHITKHTLSNETNNQQDIDYSNVI